MLDDLDLLGAAGAGPQPATVAGLVPRAMNGGEEPFDFAGMRGLCASNVLSTVGPGKVPADQWLASGRPGHTGHTGHTGHKASVGLVG